MDGHRRAALALHGLGEGDRHWVLEQLHGDHRSRLARLLEELERLGIPSDPSLLADAQKRLPEPAAPAPDRIREASAASMHAMLAREPAGLISAVLRIEAWPWQAAFLARLEPSLRKKVVASLQNEARVTEKFASTLRSCIESRLDACARPGAEPNGMRRLVAWARQRAHRGREMFLKGVARWGR
jgi:hypothetical protein